MTDWSDLVYYQCRSCHVDCINERTSARAEFKECAGCISIPSLERADPVPDPQPPTPVRSPTRVPAGTHDRGAGIPVSEPEEHSDDGENTALLAAPRDSTNSGLEDWPRAPLARPDGGDR